MSSYNGWNFGYDAESRLVSACKSQTCAAGFDKVEFAYDGEGHRTQIKETAAAGGVTTRDLRYQGDSIVEELTNGTIIRDYVVDSAGRTVKVIVPVGQTDAGTYLVTWNGHGDALALWRQNADGTLTLANSYTYSTWGQPTTATHNSIGDLGFRFLYVGAADVQWDNAFGLGLTYMHARHYSPTLGRFLQPDPARGDPNLFSYVENSPVTRADPTGLDDWWRNHRYYRNVQYANPPPPIVSSIINLGSSVACSVAVRNLKHPWAVAASSVGCWLAAAAAQWLVSAGNAKTRHEIWYNDDGRVFDEHWDTNSAGRTHYWSFTYAAGGGSVGAQRCGDVLVGRISAYSMNFLCGNPVDRENRTL